MPMATESHKEAWQAAWAAMTPEERQEYERLRERAHEDYDSLVELLERLASIRSRAFSRS